MYPMCRLHRYFFGTRFKHIYTCRYLCDHSLSFSYESIHWKLMKTMTYLSHAWDSNLQDLEEPDPEAHLAPGLVRIPQTNSLHSMCENQQFVSWAFTCLSVSWNPGRSTSCKRSACSCSCCSLASFL